VAAPAVIEKHPTCSEQRELINDCGWKGGDSGVPGKGRILSMRNVKRKITTEQNLF
jgi:hypothetical protein